MTMTYKNIREYLSTKYPDHTWVLVHQRSVRSVYRLDKNGTPQYYVKIYDPVDLAEKIRNFFRPRTLHETDMLEQLKKSGVSVPELHDHIRFRTSSALITHAVFPSTPLHEIDHEKQASIMLDLAVSLLNKGFFFTDMHAGNIILDGNQVPYLLDTYEVEHCEKITRNHIISLFAQVLNIYHISDDVLCNALRGLRSEFGASGHAREIRSKSVELRRLYVKKRVRRSLREGSFSQRVPVNGYKVFMNRKYDLDLEDILTRHNKNIVEKTNILKYQQKTQLSVVDRYCVKTYKPSRMLCAPYAVRSWKGLLLLYFNQIRVADPVAVCVFRDASSVLITEILTHPDLDVFLWEKYAGLSITDKRKIAAAFGKTIGYMHSYNIYHADLKACNIKIEPEALRFYFLDTDRIEQKPSLAYEKRLRNLVQINTSIPVHVSRGLRMEFLRAYAGYTGDEPRSLFNQVWKLSAGREILFCTTGGDRTQTWRSTPE
jgi:tRNA A-37 threonylcarbamoyl transferase component Bud32